MKEVVLDSNPLTTHSTMSAATIAQRFQPVPAASSLSSANSNNQKSKVLGLRSLQPSPTPNPVPSPKMSQASPAHVTFPLSPTLPPPYSHLPSHNQPSNNQLNNNNNNNTTTSSTTLFLGSTPSDRSSDLFTIPSFITSTLTPGLITPQYHLPPAHAPLSPVPPIL
ncbi:hypothetical protein KEM48_002010 [Puccinia striiformis f. sp. tritici PST-130]|nr:hypothetical protein KEM48_002010 [Puccinia striiformis f. sp. tritici PST-130]